MGIWFAALTPLLIMFFALAMERVEHRLQSEAVRENEVEEFLEQARPEEVRALAGQGITRAMELFRRRRRVRGSRGRASTGESGPATAALAATTSGGRATPDDAEG